MSRHRHSLEEDEALARELQQRFAAEFRQSQQQPRGRSATNVAAPPAAAPAGGGSSSWTARRGSQPVNVAPTIAALPENRRTTAGGSARTRPSVRGSSNLLPQLEPQVSDEEYALRLERALRDEERALQNSSHHRRSDLRVSDPDGLAFSSNYDFYPPESNPEYRSSIARDRGRQSEGTGDAEIFGPPPSQPRSGLSSISSHSRGSIADADEEFARRLQKEIRMEEAARASAARGGGDQRRSKQTPGVETPATLSDDVSEMTSDEEIARRIEQELRDEELARRLSVQDQARISEARARQIQAASNSVPSTRPRCTVRRTLGYLIPALVLVGAVVGVLLYFTQFSQMPDFFPTPQDFQNEDPFNAKNPDEVEKWRTKGDVGLELEIVAALESSWLPYFETAVFDWDNGSPDSLTLVKSYEEHQTACEPVNFKLVVCNGNYGNTRWRGINKILLADGYIFASTAKMNEYYFTGSSDSDSQRQYTMCHEIGHGFGLTHTDESFTNADLGNCMDYTNNPDTNKQPDETNYKFLEELYGVVPGTGNDTTAMSESVSSGNNGDGRERFRHRSLRDRPIPDWVIHRWRLMDQELDNHSHGSEQRNGWRLLHQSSFGEAHETDIGGGFSIQVHKLSY